MNFQEARDFKSKGLEPKKKKKKKERVEARREREGVGGEASGALAWHGMVHAASKASSSPLASPAGVRGGNEQKKTKSRIFGVAHFWSCGKTREEDLLRIRKGERGTL